jgi:putative holliday junction resolvase
MIVSGKRNNHREFICHFATCHLSIDRLLIEGVKSTLFCYPTAVIEDKGKILAIDLGEKRIGLAVSDETRTIATGFGVLTRKSRREDFERYAEIIEAQRITLIVMGLPITLSGEEGQRAAWIRDYSAELSQNITIPLEFWDERFSTKQAQASLHARGKRGKKMRARVDAVAAAFILQDYLDAHAGGA